MRIPIITFITFFICFAASASHDSEVKELFKKYDLIMDKHKIELVDEVFTKKFLEGNGGKEEFIAKVKELPIEKSNKLQPTQVSTKKGVKDEMYFAKVKEALPPKTEKQEPEKAKHSGSEFILVKENGKLKIDGTIGDAD